VTASVGGGCASRGPGRLARHRASTLRRLCACVRRAAQICWPNAGFMQRLIAFESARCAGRTSLQISEYEAWTKENLEGVLMAKKVDRSP
jgi:hypothetical protein